MNLRKVFKPLTLISYADMATLLSASLGFLAITYMIDGSEKSYVVAMLILPFCAIIDGMDGALARKFGTKHHYGKYLDSISDSICLSISFCSCAVCLRTCVRIYSTEKYLPT